MTEPAVLRCPLPGRVVISDAPIACPTCGAADRLILGMDLDDRGDEPSYMSCPGGHTWAEERLPRWFSAGLLDEIFQVDPTLLGRLEEIRAMQEEQGL